MSPAKIVELLLRREVAPIGFFLEPLGQTAEHRRAAVRDHR